MKHTCTPVSMVVPFYRTCAECGEEIEPVSCEHCDGDGLKYLHRDTVRDCEQCKGTGVAKWRIVE